MQEKDALNVWKNNFLILRVVIIAFILSKYFNLWLQSPFRLSLLSSNKYNARTVRCMLLRYPEPNKIEHTSGTKLCCSQSHAVVVVVAILVECWTSKTVFNSGPIKPRSSLPQVQCRRQSRWETTSSGSLFSYQCHIENGDNVCLFIVVLSRRERTEGERLVTKTQKTHRLQQNWTETLQSHKLLSQCYTSMDAPAVAIMYQYFLLSMSCRNE